jgi:hypothetical protein
MISPKRAIFGSVALSLFAISLTPAQATTYCDDIHAKVTQWQSDFNQEQVEEARVRLIKPMPQTDLPLCAVAVKARAESEELMFSSQAGACYTGVAPDLLYNTAKEGYLGLSTIVGLYHCTTR